MTNTGAGTDTMIVTSIMGMGVGPYSTHFSMEARDENDGQWIVSFTAGGNFDPHYAFAQLIRAEIAAQDEREEYLGVVINCEYNETTDKYFVTYGGYAIPLKDFDFHPIH